MSRFFVFSLFFAVLVSILTLIQYYEYRALRRWVRQVFPPARGNIILRWTRIVFGAGDILVALQFLLRGSEDYAQAVAQYGITYPAGIFFAAVIFGFLFLLVRDLV